MKLTIISWIMVFIIAIAIFYISSLTFKPGTGTGVSYLAILYHFISFFWLAFFLVFSLVQREKRNIYFLFVAILITMVYGVLDEFHQLFVPGRTCAFDDFLVDSAGILTASFIYIISLIKNFKYNPKLLVFPSLFP